MEWCEMHECWCSDLDFIECIMGCDCDECMFCVLIE